MREVKMQKIVFVYTRHSICMVYLPTFYHRNSPNVRHIFSHTSFHALRYIDNRTSLPRVSCVAIGLGTWDCATKAAHLLGVRRPGGKLEKRFNGLEVG